MITTITTPFDRETLNSLKSGDQVRINGIIYIARDAAHKKMIDLLSEGRSLPFDIKNQIIYYAGPCPAKPGKVIGSVGPTTSGRMDVYTPKLIELGLTGMIGKGERDTDVIRAMIRYGAVYFGATGGAGALIARTVKSQEVVAFPELGAEAIRRIVVEEFPAIVVIDAFGNNLYAIGRDKYSEGKS